MSVLRIHKKSQNFVILDKTCLYNASLSWGAKGLHAYLMSMRDDWRVRVSDLQNRATNGRDSVRGLLSELEQAGYITKSRCRDSVNGRFGGLEYVVHEVPEPHGLISAPEPENTSLENPGTGNPETGNPRPGNPPLINNKINNNLLNNKTAASKNLANDHDFKEEKSAAVLFEKNQEKPELNVLSPPISTLQQQDALIGQTLTPNQLKRIGTTVQKLKLSNENAILEEVSYCLLSSDHFKACGKDFSKKLNAIRTVIIRGEWQTPAGMVIESQQASTSHMQKLQQDLRDTKAEAMHFQRLLLGAKNNARAGLEEIVKKAELKIINLEAIIYKMAMNGEMLSDKNGSEKF